MKTCFVFFEFQGVSEELSSVETIPSPLHVQQRRSSFQKNLVVWKHNRIKREEKDNTGFQKNLVVWKHCSGYSFQTAYIKVSEELSSVETSIKRMWS